MFLEKYVNKFYYNLIIDNYDNEYLNMLDEDNFIKIYNIFKKYNFYFIEDIVLNYLELFEIDSDTIKKGILKLKEELGDKFVYIIGNDMRYLDRIIELED